jgi:flagellar hook-associated protein 3 FlgL
VRVTFNAQHAQATAGLQQTAQRLLDAQRQVSTGRRIERPSDDPSASAAVSVERSHLAATAQYRRAADSVDSRLTVVDTALSSLIHTLTAAQVEIVAARGTTKSASEREASAQALVALRDAVLDGLNTSFRGTFVFGGAAGTTPPYARQSDGSIGPYAGSTQEVAVDVERQQAVTIAFNGEALVLGDGGDELFAAFDTAAAAARAGDDVALGESLAALERAFSRATAMQSRVGAGMRAIDDGRQRLTQMALANQARIADLEEADLAAAITGMTQADTAHRAALGAAAALARPSLLDYLK